MLVLYGVLGFLFARSASGAQAGPMWVAGATADSPDLHVAFRGRFESTKGRCSISMCGASEYLVWLDGKLVEDGPARFSKKAPEYQSLSVSLPAGSHVLAVHAHSDGVATRVMPDVPPFLWCQVKDGDKPLPVQWKCVRMHGYVQRAHRISGNLGWIDWCDTSAIPPGWENANFDDSSWPLPGNASPGIGLITEAGTRPVQLIEHEMQPMEEGNLTEGFGYATDDPAARFFLEDLSPKSLPPQGVWRRYDLGRIRLGRPVIDLDAPRGSTVEIAMCEELRHGRVHPWITLSGSESCNMDHYVTRGGLEEFMPFTPKGGRFIEVHVLATGAVKFGKEAFLERTYYGEPEGTFKCSDPVLNRIWETGAETTRACAEDALIDCPTRERGEWTGDTATVATENCAAVYSDLSLSRRALVQAAQLARSDGLVAGLEPGQPQYVSTYAALWVAACVRYWELSGDKSLLSELLPAADRDIAAFASKMTPYGLEGDLGWEFVDWGYVPSSGPSDMALNIDFYMALKAMSRWHIALGQTEASRSDLLAADKLGALIKAWIRNQVAEVGGWRNVGYHRAALALLAGLVDDSNVAPCVSSIETHLLTCFPNDQDAPRLSDPSVKSDRLMTPFFCQFAFAALLEHGQTGFVLHEYRRCWGWALDQGWTTWPEVFDPRWSLCHGWSGCPTWQLSRYVLGISPRFDLGPGVFDVRIRPGELAWASGDVPLGDGQKMHVEWKAPATGIHLTVTSPKKVILRLGDRNVAVDGLLSETLPR